MKAKPLKQTENGYQDCEPIEATHIELHLPGPLPHRIIPVEKNVCPSSNRIIPIGKSVWSWNQNVDSPTITPSIRTRATVDIGGGVFRDHVCHSLITDGIAYFYTDSSHQFAGQNLPLLDVE